MRYLLVITIVELFIVAIVLGGCSSARELPQGNHYAEAFEIVDLDDVYEQALELAR